MNRHVKLLRLLWNSRPKEHQSENEKYLRQEILDNGKLRHHFPWIAHDIELADLRDPKFFFPIETSDHTSNLFDEQHFGVNEFDLRHIQPSTLDQIWTSQHTQWLVLQKQEASAFSDPEQCLQAHTEAIMKYLAARRLNQEAAIVNKGTNPWTWLAVAISYIEQHPVELARLLSATTPNGERKEHYVEQLRRAELARLHNLRVESLSE
jgi:hypothetical protein